MSEEAMREEVAQAVEVAANKAAEEEISKLTEFESAIDETLASGYLDDTLTVTDADGVAQVLPVLDSEPISHLVEGLEAVGGSANVFVHTSAGVVALSVWNTSPAKKRSSRRSTHGQAARLRLRARCTVSCVEPAPWPRTPKNTISTITKQIAALIRSAH